MTSKAGNKGKQMLEQRYTPASVAEQLRSRRGTITLTELAEIFDRPYKTVYKWVRKCGLPANKIAGTYWVDPHDVADWWNAHSTAMMPKPPKRVAYVA